MLFKLGKVIPKCFNIWNKIKTRLSNKEPLYLYICKYSNIHIQYIYIYKFTIYIYTYIIYIYNIIYIIYIYICKSNTGPNLYFNSVSFIKEVKRKLKLHFVKFVSKYCVLQKNTHSSHITFLRTNFLSNICIEVMKVAIARELYGDDKMTKYY